MGLPQRCHTLRQNVPILEIGEREACRFFLRGTSGYQLSVAVFQMLREFLDDLVLAGWREAERRESRGALGDTSL